MISERNHTGDLQDCVHALWIGNKLSALELLTITSFLRNNHCFVLWAYERLENELPEGLIIKDAGLIIPGEQVFQYRNSNQFGHGKGSYAGFSDIFRYKLLYEYGGWWTDMDVTCLKPLDFTAPYVFRTHHDLKVVGNIMKCPPKSELMRRCYDKAVAEVDAANRDWNKPIRILNDAIDELGLQKYIVEMSNRDSWNDVRKLIMHPRKIQDHWFVIHWVNEEWRRNGISKGYSGKNSVLRGLYEKYGVAVRKLPFAERLTNRLRLTFVAGITRYLWSWGWGHVAFYLKRGSG
jgi:mannosyltransferase OCH1-like enzyme